MLPGLINPMIAGGPKPLSVSFTDGAVVQNPGGDFTVNNLQFGAAAVDRYIFLAMVGFSVATWGFGTCYINGTPVTVRALNDWVGAGSNNSFTWAVAGPLLVPNGTTGSIRITASGAYPINDMGYAIVRAAGDYLGIVTPSSGMYGDTGNDTNRTSIDHSGIAVPDGGVGFFGIGSTASGTSFSWSNGAVEMIDNPMGDDGGGGYTAKGGLAYKAGPGNGPVITSALSSPLSSMGLLFR